MVALFAQQSNIVEFPQKSNEWYTPARYVEAARSVMGGIDLDPASCKEANETVKATRFYTKEDDGLSKPWYGRIFLNPPYRLAGRDKQGYFKSSIEAFTTKLFAEYEAGDIEQAVLCVMGKIDAQWFQPLWNYPICFADHIVTFVGHKRKGQKTALKHMWGTLFVYIGPHEQKFISTFSQFGTVARRVSVPKVQPVNLRLWEVN